MKKYLFLIAFLFCVPSAQSTSGSHYQDCNGAILRSNFLFSYDGASYDLKEKFKRLSHNEAYFTPFVAMQSEKSHMRNISLGAFSYYNNDNKYKDKDIEQKSKRCLFESGTFSVLLKNHRNLIEKCGKGQPPKGIQETKQMFNNVALGTLSTDRINVMMKHFNVLWGNYDLSYLEETFYKNSALSEYKTIYDKMLAEIFNDDEPGINLEFMETHNNDSLPSATPLFDKLVSEVQNAKEYDKLDSLFDCIKKIQDKEKVNKGKYKDILQRWCSEQKIMAFILENIDDFIPEEDTDIKAIFLMIHTYQAPCTCCRMSLVRFSKIFSKRLLKKFNKLKFHVVVSYRQDFDDRKDYVPMTLKKSPDDAKSYLEKNFPNALRPFDDTGSSAPLPLEAINDHSISMIKIEP